MKTTKTNTNESTASRFLGNLFSLETVIGLSVAVSLFGWVTAAVGIGTAVLISTAIQGNMIAADDLKRRERKLDMEVRQMRLDAERAKTL